MTEPGFRIEGRQQTAPFLARTTFPDYHLFSDATCAVLVEPNTARDIRAAAVRALPRETGGLLSGRALRDDHGGYMVVSGFIEAAPNAGRPAAFQITTKELGELRTRAARANPGADEVGWWHTHRGPSVYSPTDHNTQRMFERPDSIGLLVFASGTHWGFAYVGPDARDLGFPSVPRPARAAELAGQPGPAPRQAIPAGSPGQGGYADAGAVPGGPGQNGSFTILGPLPEVSRRLSPQAILLIALAVILVLVLVMIFALLGISNVSGQVSSLRQTTSGQIGQLATLDNGNYQKLSARLPSAAPATPSPVPSTTPSPIATAASVSWSCAHVSGGLNCNAVSSPGTNGQGWHVDWLVNGVVAGPGWTNVPIPITKKAKVQAVLVSPTGQRFPGPTQTLSP